MSGKVKITKKVHLVLKEHFKTASKQKKEFKEFDKQTTYKSYINE